VHDQDLYADIATVSMLIPFPGTAPYMGRDAGGVCGRSCSLEACAEERCPVVERRDGIWRGVGHCLASGLNWPLARREKTLRLGCISHPD
jgi:hypothetical protein